MDLLSIWLGVLLGTVSALCPGGETVIRYGQPASITHPPWTDDPRPGRLFDNDLLTTWDPVDYNMLRIWFVVSSTEEVCTDTLYFATFGNVVNDGSLLEVFSTSNATTPTLVTYLLLISLQGSNVPHLLPLGKMVCSREWRLQFTSHHELVRLAELSLCPNGVSRSRQDEDGSSLLSYCPGQRVVSVVPSKVLQGFPVDNLFDGNLTTFWNCMTATDQLPAGVFSVELQTDFVCTSQLRLASNGDTVHDVTWLRVEYKAALSSAWLQAAEISNPNRGTAFLQLIPLGNRSCGSHWRVTMKTEHFQPFLTDLSLCQEGDYSTDPNPVAATAPPILPPPPARSLFYPPCPLCPICPACGTVTAYADSGGLSEGQRDGFTALMLGGIVVVCIAMAAALAGVICIFKRREGARVEMNHQRVRQRGSPSGLAGEEFGEPGAPLAPKGKRVPRGR